MTDPDLLNPMGDSAIGTINAHQLFSGARVHGEFCVAGFKKTTGARPSPLDECI